jgi:hypothetical protein
MVELPEAESVDKNSRDPSTPRPSVNEAMALLRRSAQEYRGMERFRESLPEMTGVKVFMESGRGPQIFSCGKEKQWQEWFRSLFVDTEPQH